MSRPLPKVRAASWYHAVNRGVERAVLFATSNARDDFVRTLGEIAYAFPVEIQRRLVTLDIQLVH